MEKRSSITMVLWMLAGVVLGVASGLYSQTPSLAGLVEEKANISKMDWAILNTRVYVLEQTLKDDLSLPLSPTHYRYDPEKHKIRISVHVNFSWLAKSNFNQVSQALSARATALCIAPTGAQDGELLAWFLTLEKPPVEYCAIRFFTVILDADGNIGPKDVASFEDGELVMK